MVMMAVALDVIEAECGDQAQVGLDRDDADGAQVLAGHDVGRLAAADRCGARSTRH